MLAEERKIKILELIREDGSAKVSNLSKIFEVSEPTIRQDLEKLEQEGHVIREHGGAILKNVAQHVQNLMLEHEQENRDQKMRIGQKAAEFIVDGDSLILDSGSTTTAIANQLSSKSNLTIVTNALNIALMLGANYSFEILMTGGEFKAPTLSLTGEKASVFFQQIHVNKLFLATAGISFQAGLSYPGLSDIHVKKAMIACADTVYLVADSTKIGKNAFAAIGCLDQIDYFITDAGITSDAQAAFEKIGITVIIAD